jgi:hypothetical protein
VLPLCHCTHDPACHQIPLVSPKCSNDGEEPGALTSPKHLSQEPHDIHDEMSDASTDPDLKHIHTHGCLPEDNVSVITDMEELIGEVTEMMDTAADNNLMIFFPIDIRVQDILITYRR